MSGPKLENGHIRIANELWEALSMTRIPGEARQVLDAIIRLTWGWGKKSDHISIKQLYEATRIPKPRIIRARKKLVDMNIINVAQKGNKKTPNYCFNKYYLNWKTLPKKATNQGKILIGRVGIRDIKKNIRERDINCCLCCGYDGSLTKENLHVHHIDFDQTNNGYDNLITLCKSCHGKAHNNDKDYKEYLLNLVAQKGNEKTLPKKAIEIAQKGNEPLPKKATSLITNHKTNKTILQSKQEAIIFDKKTWTFLNITQNQVNRWKQAFPLIDIWTEILRAGMWLESKNQVPNNRASEFLFNWFKKAKPEIKESEDKPDSYYCT